MKPIFIILYPISTSITHEDSKRFGLELYKEYHVLFFCNNKDVWDFKLLNGTQEEYNKLSEITEQILMKELI